MGGADTSEGSTLTSEFTLAVKLPGYGKADLGCRYLVPAATIPEKQAVIVVGVPGATYDGRYFTCPVPGYSFAARVGAAGWGFLAVDRLGIGLSSAVPSEVASLANEGIALAEALRFARARARQVVLLGHSHGSSVAVEAAAMVAGTADSPDLVVLTGYGHPPGIEQQLGYLDTTVAPASGDPRYADADAGWVLVKPDARRLLFYGDDVSPDVWEWDREQAAVMASVAALKATIMQQGKAPGNWPCAWITQPLLLVNGELDVLAGKPGLDDNGLDVHERPFYPRSSAFTARAISGAAHDLALDPTAERSFDVVAEWIRQTLPALAQAD
jgi:pimeloyl-ACP methyl ester carboxylesterase